jgi:hypothetical protein
MPSHDVPIVNPKDPSPKKLLQLLTFDYPAVPVRTPSVESLWRLLDLDAPIAPTSGPQKDQSMETNEQLLTHDAPTIPTSGLSENRPMETHEQLLTSDAPIVPASRLPEDQLAASRSPTLSGSDSDASHSWDFPDTGLRIFPISELLRMERKPGRLDRNDGRPAPKTSEEMRVSLCCTICLTQQASVVLVPCGKFGPLLLVRRSLIVQQDIV